MLCLSSGGCETVQASRWAKLDGIPVSVLGLIGYIGILGSLAIRTELGRAGGFAIALIGFGFSMYLTYRELFTIKAICQWCVGSAVLMTLLAVITAVRFLRDDGLSSVSIVSAARLRSSRPLVCATRVCGTGAGDHRIPAARLDPTPAAGAPRRL